MRLPLDSEGLSQLTERFWDKVEKPRVPGSCWLWQGGKGEKGYGRFTVGGRMEVASRVSYAIHKGPIPSGMIVCHSCDTPACVNPDHLWVGRQEDNMADMDRKGRRVPSWTYTPRPTGSNVRGVFSTGPKPPGYVHNRSKLTPEQAVEIRSRLRNGERPADIAPLFGVSRQNIYNVAKARTWDAFDRA